MRNSENFEYLQNKLTEIEVLTNKISEFLDKDSYSEDNYISNLDSLYMSRKKELTEFKRLMTTFNSLIDDTLAKRVEDLIVRDKNNLDKLNKKIEFIRINLRKLSNKKSLLLYR